MGITYMSRVLVTVIDKDGNHVETGEKMMKVPGTDVELDNCLIMTDGTRHKLYKSPNGAIFFYVTTKSGKEYKQQIVV